MINAVRYLVRSGCGRWVLPIHFDHWRTVYGWFRELARRFLFQTIHDVALMLDRERAGAPTRPRPFSLARPSRLLLPGSRGFHGAKKVIGRKRHIAVCTYSHLPMATSRRATSPTAPERRQ